MCLAASPAWCQQLCFPPQSVPGHMYNKFTWGNRESLWVQPAKAGIDVRTRLLEYYHK